MDCACKTYHEEQLDLLLSIMRAVASSSSEQKQSLTNEMAKKGLSAMGYIDMKLQAWQKDIITSQKSIQITRTCPPTWTDTLLAIVNRFRDDIVVLNKANGDYSKHNQNDTNDEEQRNIREEKKMILNLAYDYTSGTFLELLLHMFDVPRKAFEFTSDLVKTMEAYAIKAREKIVDFYPPETNYHLFLYTDPKNHRLDQQKNEENITFLHECAIYLLKTNNVMEDRASKLHLDLTTMKSMLDARTIAGYKTLHEALRQLMELA